MKLDPSAMAEKIKEPDYFTPGSQVSLTMIGGASHSGEVVAHDQETHFLWIKRQMPGQHEQSEVMFINMDYVARLEFKDENVANPEPMPFIPINKVKSRLAANVNEFRKQKMYIGENVSPEGQQLMDSIAKTITDVKWDEDKIVVMECVMITPPYTVAQTRMLPGKDSTQNMTTLAHIRKMVEKHQQDERSRQAQNSTPRRSTSPSPSPAPSSSSTSSTS